MIPHKAHDALNPLTRMTTAATLSRAREARLVHRANGLPRMIRLAGAWPHSSYLRALKEAGDKRRKGSGPHFARLK